MAQEHLKAQYSALKTLFWHAQLLCAPEREKTTPKPTVKAQTQHVWHRQGSVTASPWNALCSQCRGINNFPLNSPPSHYPVLADALLQAQVLPKKNPKTIGREEKMAFGSCRSPVLFCGCSFTEPEFTQAGRNHRRWELCGREIKQQSKCHGEILLLNPQCPSSQHGSRAAAPWLDFKNRKVTSFQSQSAVLCFRCHFRPWECSQRAHSSSGKRWKMPPSRICCLN